MSEQQEEKIVLNLANHTDVVKLGNNELFQKEAETQLFAKIKQQLKTQQYSDGQDDELFYDRFHNAITVCGARGSGKSTFLRHVLTQLNDVKEKITKDNPGELKANVPVGLSVLPVIDPTLISSKEHVLIILISQIRHKVDSAKKAITEEKYAAFKKSLTALAGGLCQIDGIGAANNYGDEWGDKTYVLETGLAKATEGFSLEKNLHKFINAALDALDRYAFVVTFDDIDTQFERGWPVLETVRKYLTTPQLVIIISGDIELYSTLVRAAQLASLGKNVLEYERPSVSFHAPEEVMRFSQDPILRKVGDLEEQYLMKVLKPESRVHMQTLEQWRMRKNHDFDVIVVKPPVEEECRIFDYLGKALEYGFGITNETEQNDYLSTILSSPARTLWQFIKAAALLAEKSDKENVADFALRLTDIYSSSLTRLGFKPLDFYAAQNSLSKLLAMMWHWGLNQNNWLQFGDLKPNSSSGTINQQILAFQSLVQSQTHFNLGDAIEFMLLIGWIKELLIVLPERTGGEAKIEDILQYINIGENYSGLSNTVAACCTAMIAVDSNESYKAGFYHIPESASGFKLDNAWTHFYENPVKKKRTKVENIALNKKLSINDQSQVFSNNEYLKGWWDELLANVYVKDKMIGKENNLGLLFNRLDSIESNFGDAGKLPNLAMVTRRNPTTGEMRTYLSFIPLFANIAELLKKGVKNKQALQEHVLELINAKAIYDPKWQHNTDVGAEITKSEDENVGGDYAGDYDKFFGHLYEWAKNAHDVWMKLTLSPNLLLKIFDRYHKQLDSLNDGNPKDRYAGNLLHFQIVAFIHAAMYEEAKNSGKVAVQPKGISQTEREFFQNFKKVDEIPSINAHYERVFEGNSLVKIILSCPLIGIFLRQTPKQFTGLPEHWNWLQIHAANYLSLTRDESYQTAHKWDKSYVGSLAFQQLDSRTKKGRASLRKAAREELMKAMNVKRDAVIAAYLTDIKVHGGFKQLDATVAFDNLYPILNTLPVLNKVRNANFLTATVTLNLVDKEAEQAAAKGQTDELSVIMEEDEKLEAKKTTATELMELIKEVEKSASDKK